MAKKSIKVSVDCIEVDIFIRRVKAKELKPLVIKLAEKGDELLKAFASGGFAKKLPGLINENLDFICDELILPLAEISPERLEEMDVVDVIGLVKELLSYNGIDAETIINFLKPYSGLAQMTAQKMDFEGITIPSQE